MAERATWKLEQRGWDEQPFGEVEGGAKLARASVTQGYSGDIEGEGMLEYLMLYQTDGPVTFEGLERVVGRVAGRAGSFILRHSGTFEGDTARSAFSVVPGSATGDLAGLRGDGSFAWKHGESGEGTLAYDLA